MFICNLPYTDENMFCHMWIYMSAIKRIFVIVVQLCRMIINPSCDEFVLVIA